MSIPEAAPSPRVVDRTPSSATGESSPTGGGGGAEPPRTPFLLDFYPLEDAKYTRISRFFEELRAGHLTTTRCPTDGRVLWPPRLVCPECHRGDLEWTELPSRGRLYAFSAVLAGAPLGMEKDVPFVVGLVELEGIPLRIFSRIAGVRWEEARIGLEVELEPYTLEDGRVFFRFRQASGGSERTPPGEAAGKVRCP